MEQNDLVHHSRRKYYPFTQLIYLFFYEVMAASDVTVVVGAALTLEFGGFGEFSLFK